MKSDSRAKPFVERYRTAVVVVKSAMGAAELSLGVVLLTMSADAIRALVDRLSREERVEDPNDPLVLFVQHRLPLLASNKTVLALTLLLLGSAKVVGAIGLLRRRPWGYWVLVVLLCALLPFDVYRVATRPSLLQGVLLMLNLAVLLILLRYRADLTAAERKPGRR